MRSGFDENGATSLERGLDLFLALADPGLPQSLSEIADRLALPISTAHRLLSPFLERGLLIRVGRGRYCAGAQLIRLGGRLREADILVAAARPLARRLARVSGMHVHVGTLIDDMVHYHVKESGQDEPIFTREGIQLEAYCSAIGKLLLGFATPQYLARYIDSGNFIPLTASTLTHPEALRAALVEARRRGEAWDREEVAEGMTCVAAPVRDYRDEVIAAISLSTVSPPHALEHFVPALHETAQDISRKLGWRNPDPAPL